MLGRSLIASATLVSLVGCSKLTSVATTGDAGDAGASTAPSPTASPTTPGALSCEALLPVAFRNKYYAGYTLRQGPVATPTSVSCTFVKGSDARGFGYVCGAEPMKGIEAGRKNAGAKEVAGVGRGAVMWPALKGSNLVTVLLVDDDTKCWITASGTSDQDWASIGREALAALTPQLVPVGYR